MKELERTVDTLSRELPEALLQLRSDNLRESLTKIETMYDTITDLMETAVTLPEDISDVERDTGILDRINDFLAEDGPRSFLRQAVQKAFDKSDDFVSYYQKSKTSMLSYWVVVVKGISLLQMAYDAPNVDFSEGTLTIRRQKDKLDGQERLFKAVVGENTVRLIECALLRPSSTHITLLSNEGFGIGPKRPSIGDITSLSIFTGNRIPIHRRSEDPDIDKMASMWNMPLGCGFDAHLRYAVRFVYFSSGRCLSHNGLDVSMVKNDGQFTSHSVSWLIKPICPSSDRYTIRVAIYLPESMVDEIRAFLITGRRERSDFSGAHLVARDFLQLENYVR
ncbi:hypothetical protein FOXG_17737 [Fusarium oxysporum f. sp. lycopersici 4287]|uniref:Uncharacterized protein n=2 Tax=Fusarium oxysporum TaxID=5507 RepID=A0A0J9U9D3_FUSO4|nr:hypothetical protein FOXG_17737 [Fusarium oxysporum f. sp. lycopersici 4287]KAJ9428031.1 hypothetical protein QL093DRAFT_2623039 [Fusarium oxysporum]KNA95858.1 hypothetical protein FOXG_17737 [Fusarium oxysporum f. sp. lycopersici 4287]